MKHYLITLLLLLPFVITAQKELTLYDAVMNQYRDFYPSGTAGFMWIPGTDNYSVYDANYQSLLRGNVKNDETEVIITTDEMNKATGATFRYSKIDSWKDGTHFYTSAEGMYYLIDTENKTAEIIGGTPSVAEEEFLHPSTGAIAYNGNGVGIIGKANEGQNVIDDENGYVNGKAIARSEFGITTGIFWSNSGKYLGFYRKDESNVADYPLLDITTPTGSLNAIKYPMAGQGSELSGAGIFNRETEKTILLKPEGDSEDYMTNFGWSMDDKYVFIAEVNRDQNHMKLQKYEAETGKFLGTLFEEKNDKWVEPENPPYFVSNDQFIWLSERDGFMNMYLYDVEGKLIKQLTNNEWVIKGIDGHDDAGNVYFHGTGDSPLETHYFKVNIKSGKQTQLTNESGTHRVSFSSDFAYMHDAFSSTEIPNIETIKDAKGKVKRTLITAKNKLADYKIGTAEFGTIKAADETTDLHYRIIKPSDFDPSKKYPVLVYVYGGPHAQLVTNSWYGGASLWMYWMAEQGYIVYTVDNRGSANRGFEFESVIHRNLGDAEMADQMEGVKFLKGLDYVQGDRIAVHGWSFGGFMTTSLMLRYPGEFTTGVAGGPVTDWSYYEVMYGERYMDRPEQNEEGYKKARLMNYVDRLQGELLLIHGTVDDVVVMQHNLALVKAFVDAGVQMDFFPYPMHPHNVRGKDRVHLMEKVLTYIIKNNK